MSASRVREGLRTVAFMVLVTFVFTAAVAGAYVATKPIIEANEALFLRRAVLFAADVPVPAAGADVVREFGARVTERRDQAGAVLCWEVRDPVTGQRSGWVLPATGSGLWGTIRAVVGFDAAGARLTGLEFLEQNETPGLGGRIAEDWFRNQFRRKAGPFTTVAEGAPAGDGQFDAITGATITSAAVRDMLNRLCGHVRNVVRRF